MTRSQDPLRRIAIICAVVAGVLLLFSQLAHHAVGGAP